MVMIKLMSPILLGISAFIATNIDDILILMFLFSQINSHLRYQHIITGQYLGFIVLVISSLPGLLGGLIIPPNWIGLLGLIPIAMGMSNLINQEDDDTQNMKVVPREYSDTNTSSIFNTQTYTVALITVANGSDNISVYIPMFASSSLNDVLIIIGIFFILIAVWCYLAYKLTLPSKISNFNHKKLNFILPFFLIFLGTFVVLKTQALNIIKLAASCLCLLILVTKNRGN
jgi:cadmium resistance transport/sequestration family protein